MADKLRADVALVKSGLCESREKAQAQIMAGLLYLGERKIIKPSELVEEGAELTLRGAVHPYVSRGGLKLEKALNVFHADVNGCVAMDIGAATGGFTDVLLRNGAKHVYAIDVGYGQLDWRLRNDPRVTVMERTNARHLTREHLPLWPKVTVMDVSFISIKLILPVAVQIMGDEGRFLTLIKPQFEAGRGKVGKKGVVRDPRVHEEVLLNIVSFVNEMGWQVNGLDFSPITGPEGNIEFVALIQKENRSDFVADSASIAALVEKAHAALQKRVILE